MVREVVCLLAHLPACLSTYYDWLLTFCTTLLLLLLLLLHPPDGCCCRD